VSAQAALVVAQEPVARLAVQVPRSQYASPAQGMPGAALQGSPTVGCRAHRNVLSQ
jgi:hypothetical protein